MIPSAAKVRQNMFSSKHVVLSWKLHILTELRMGPSKVWACNRDEIAHRPSINGSKLLFPVIKANQIKS